MTHKTTQLSSPFATGGGGFHFEAEVQASFVVLMLSGGFAPCLPCWPINKIKLQGKVEGYETDDLIITVEDKETKDQRKLLGQIKYSIPITLKSDQFCKVIHAAWKDYNNPDIFTKQKDIIALITGPMSATDNRNVQWLLNQAKVTNDVDEFLRYVQQTNFSPSQSSEKLDVIRNHLKTANSGVDVSEDKLYTFLNHFYILSYDLGNEHGVVLSLLHSHISQFNQQYPGWIWPKIVNVVQSRNQNAGTITVDNLPEDLIDVFRHRITTEIPVELTAIQQDIEVNGLDNHQYATELALLNLVGRWDEGNKSDIEVLSKLLRSSYDDWIQHIRAILDTPSSPLSLKNGIWKISNRIELMNTLKSKIFDQHLDTFKSIIVPVLSEKDPAFELPPEDRYAARAYGKELTYSPTLRKGLSEGLAILGNNTSIFEHCSQGKIENTVILVIRELLANADWIRWGSLDLLLPTLAESAPEEFLNAVEGGLVSSPCPFDHLFHEEGRGIFGSNYITGLLWALEALAWDESYLVQVCVLLAGLASRDPGGQWANRPANSLSTILLPWLPQTIASIDKRKVTVQTILTEYPTIGWELIINLLPGRSQTSSGSYKSSWRNVIPEEWKERVPKSEYLQQVLNYADLAISIAGYDINKLVTLLDISNQLPKPFHNRLIPILSSEEVIKLPEDQRRFLWNHLVKFTTKHRRYSDAGWALPEEQLKEIDTVADRIAPSNPFNLHQHLFSDRDFDLYEVHLQQKSRHINLIDYSDNNFQGSSLVSDNPKRHGYVFEDKILPDSRINSSEVPDYFDRIYDKAILFSDI